MPRPFPAGRYHSLAVTVVPDELEITARTASGTVMGLRHRSAPIEGVQFHPESVLTAHGRILLSNWLAQIIARAD
jgi:para-aminobenzoate synthetase component 2